MSVHFVTDRNSVYIQYVPHTVIYNIWPSWELNFPGCNPPSAMAPSEICFLFGDDFTNLLEGGGGGGRDKKWKMQISRRHNRGSRLFTNNCCVCLLGIFWLHLDPEREREREKERDKAKERRAIISVITLCTCILWEGWGDGGGMSLQGKTVLKDLAGDLSSILEECSEHFHLE